MLVVLGNQALTNHSLGTSAKKSSCALGFCCPYLLFVVVVVCFLLLKLLWMQIVLHGDLSTGETLTFRHA